MVCVLSCHGGQLKAGCGTLILPFPSSCVQPHIASPVFISASLMRTKKSTHFLHPSPVMPPPSPFLSLSRLSSQAWLANVTWPRGWNEWHACREETRKRSHICGGESTGARTTRSNYPLSAAQGGRAGWRRRRNFCLSKCHWWLTGHTCLSCGQKHCACFLLLLLVTIRGLQTSVGIKEPRRSSGNKNNMHKWK